MKAAELKHGSIYQFNGNFGSHKMQFIGKHKKPPRWMFKRIESTDAITGIAKTASDKDIWMLSVNDLKKLSADTSS